MIEDLWENIETLYKKLPLNTRNRLYLTFLMYRHYVLNHNWKITYQELLDNFQIKLSEKRIGDYEELFQNIEQYEEKVSKLLGDNWTFDRLNNLDKSVLILGCYEINYLKITKNIVINEYLKVIKLFNVDDNYNYINSVLDKI
ncbi:transcription antitermination factor NusB [Spiroplasma endosymbiont of Amphibalanus improvisus]|uniref:transcription antitermination factor NusB n=1 Tax=Spiroplasma endosymbiont of Amphibalanus improvisus TaxID=3066327 RepID=UPI00313C8DBA